MARKLTKREKHLVALLLTAACAGGLLVFFKWYSPHVASQRAAITSTSAELSELDLWVAERNIWRDRTEWLANHHPPAYRAEDTKSACVEWTQNSASAAGLALSDLQLREEISTGGIVEVGMSVVITGRLEHLVRWMHRVHEAGGFREMREIKITSDADNSKVRAEILIVFLCESSTAT